MVLMRRILRLLRNQPLEVRDCVTVLLHAPGEGREQIVEKCGTVAAIDPWRRVRLSQLEKRDCFGRLIIIRQRPSDVDREGKIAALLPNDIEQALAGFEGRRWPSRRQFRQNEPVQNLLT